MSGPLPVPLVEALLDTIAWEPNAYRVWHERPPADPTLTLGTVRHLFGFPLPCPATAPTGRTPA